MGNAAGVLLSLRLRQMLRAGLTSGRPAFSIRAQGRVVLGLIVLIYLGWRLYTFGSRWVAGQTAVSHSDVFEIMQPALTALAAGAGTMMLFYAFSALIGRFLDGRDLQLLLVAPVPAELIFGERILITSLGFSGILCISVPALFAIGTGVGVTPWFYVAVLAGILVLPLVPTSVASLILLGLLHRLPPARARTISLAISLASVLLLVILTRESAGSTALPSLPAWLPTTWPARAIVAIGLGDTASLAGYGLLSIGLSAGSFLCATFLSARVLGTGVFAYSEVVRGAGRAHRARRAGGTERQRGMRPAWWPVFLKDWLVLRRDSQRQLLFLYPLGLVAFNAYQVLSHPRSTGHAVAVATTLALLILASLLLVNTTTPGIVNWEGHSLVLLALAPVSAAGIVLGKWIVALVPPLLMVQVALIGLAIYLRLPVDEVAVLSLTLAFLIGALAGTTLMLNITWPRLDASNARRPSSVTAGIVGLLIDGAVSVGTGLMLFLILFAWHGALSRAGEGVLLVALTMIILFTLQLGAAAMRRLLRGGSLARSAP
jgi:ABC-2 type transport system permease protein